MKNVLSRENMRLSDQAAVAGGCDEVALVWRAAEAIADAVRWVEPVAIVCGKGNNGADGLALALVLHRRKVAVTALSVVMGPNSAARHHYYGVCLAEGVDVRVFSGANDLDGFATVVDCVLGIGAKGAPRLPAVPSIEAINRCGAYVVSVDINSGLDADSGMATLAVHSRLTVSVGGFKTGHFVNMAKDFADEVINVDIGIEPVQKPYRLVEPQDLAAEVEPRKRFCNKGDFGYVALIGGSLPYSGAIRLAAMAAGAMRAGAGVVKIAAPAELCPLLVPQVLESTLFPLAQEDGHLLFVEDEFARLVANTRCVAFGMGVGVGAHTTAALRYLLANYEGRLIVDADGLTALAALPEEEVRRHRPALVLTPHAKEFARLVGCTIDDVLSDGVAMAEAYARRTGAVVLLKGPTTVVSDGNDTYLVSVGGAGMATAGSGDVLSGILAATCAYREALVPAVYYAAYLNGRAGELAEAEVGDVSMIASDTVRMIPAAIAELRRING